LLNALLDAAAERECEAVLLEVRASNDGAIALYKEAGFKALAKRRGYYSHPREDAVVMRKKLAAGLFSKSRVP
jgi:putative ribosomal-protein-alanine acetyltransferase, rimI-like protein